MNKRKKNLRVLDRAELAMVTGGEEEKKPTRDICLTIKARDNKTDVLHTSST